MKRFFSKNGIWLLAAIAIAVVVLSIMSAIGNGFLRDIFGDIAKPFRSAGTAVTQWVRRIDDRFDQIEDLQAENEALRQQIAALEQKVRDQQDDALENRQLRSLLDLRDQRTDLQLQDAIIIESAASNWFSSFTLNRGTHSGIAEGDCVVDAYGNLVGVVTEAGDTWCTVTTILDTASQIGAMVFRTQTPAIASGSLSYMTQDRLILTYVGNDISLLNGDLVITSGLGGYYPYGLTIATVEELHTDDSGMSHYAVLRPRADFAALTQVFVITDFTTEG